MINNQVLTLLAEAETVALRAGLQATRQLANEQNPRCWQNYQVLK